MGTYQDLVERAKIGTVAVISTLLHRTLDTLVCVAVHHFLLLPFGFETRIPPSAKKIPGIQLLFAELHGKIKNTIDLTH